jgi:cytochrome c553
VVLFLAVLGLSSSLMADAFTKCAGCHGANGEKSALKKSGIMSDLTKAEIVASLKGYKENTSSDPMKKLMAAQVKDLSDADIEAIAAKIGK